MIKNKSICVSILLPLTVLFSIFTILDTINNSIILKISPDLEEGPAPQAIIEPISGILYPGREGSHRYGGFYEVKGAPIYITVNWDPPAPILIAVTCEAGYSRGKEIYGGSWSGVIDALARG